MPDSKIIITAILVIAAFTVLQIIKQRTASDKYTIKNYDKNDLKQYYLQKSILTGPELILYRVIVKHMQGSYIIATKVRMADFINIKRQNKSGPTSTQAAFNRISGKHCDYMICDMKGKPLAWIELDDKSHGTATARKADKFKNEVAIVIGIPLYRIKTGTNYNEQISHIKNTLR